MAELILGVVLGFVGFSMGGFIGVTCFDGWFPACWYGLVIGLAIGICPEALLFIDFND